MDERLTHLLFHPNQDIHACIGIQIQQLLTPRVLCQSRIENAWDLRYIWGTEKQLPFSTIRWISFVSGKQFCLSDGPPELYQLHCSTSDGSSSALFSLIGASMHVRDRRFIFGSSTACSVLWVKRRVILPWTLKEFVSLKLLLTVGVKGEEGRVSIGTLQLTIASCLIERGQMQYEA